jgi:hypothetical protein
MCVFCFYFVIYFITYSIKLYWFTHNNLLPIIWNYTNNNITFYQIDINIISIYEVTKGVQLTSLSNRVNKTVLFHLSRYWIKNVKYLISLSTYYKAFMWNGKNDKQINLIIISNQYKEGDRCAL